MITGEYRNKVDKLWTEFWTGGITNPLTVIEQISFLMFTRLLDIRETLQEKKLSRTGGKDRSGLMYDKNQQKLRWQNFRNLQASEMLKLVRDEVFPHFRELGKDTTFGEYMQDAQLMIQKPNLLVSAVNMIDELPLDKGDIKGDLYEYLLSKLTTAGINGQFRTPRHVIKTMVRMLNPKPDEKVGDPACGTSGFLVETMQYLYETHSSKAGTHVHPEKDEDGVPYKTYTGDLLEPYRKHIQNDMFHGFDFDITMLRIAAMNLMLHGVDNPDIHYQDTLSTSFTEKFKGQSQNYFDVILANPPFKGSLDENDIHPSLYSKVKTGKTELLFIALILRMLKLGGRSATIVPDGVLFGSSKAHLAVRKLLIDENQLEGIVSLPSGVFKPYAGVQTAIVLFTKGGKTKDVWFYDVEADGYSLDDKRERTKENDLPDVLKRWEARDPKKDKDRKAKAFCVPADEIREKDYDLSINKYKEHVYEEVKYDPPKVILKRLKDLEVEISKDLQNLEKMLG